MWHSSAEKGMEKKNGMNATVKMAEAMTYN